MASFSQKTRIIEKASEPLLIAGYLKKDGSFRVVEFRKDVPGKRGGSLRYDPKQVGGIVIYDMECARAGGGPVEKIKTKRRKKGRPKAKSCHRTLLVNRIAWVIADGVLYDFRPDRTAIPKDIADIDNKRNKITKETGDDEVEEGVLLDNPKTASLTYSKFKIMNMRISSRE